MRHSAVATAAALATAALIWGAAPAAAQGTAPAEPIFADGSGLRAELAVGLAISSSLRRADDPGETSPELGLGVTTAYRHGGLLVGAKVDTQSNLGSRSSHFGVLGGVSIRLGSASRLEATGDGGLHVVSDIGDDLFVEDVMGEQTETIPYVGGRIAFAYRPGENLYVTFWASMTHDLAKEQADVTVTTCLLGCQTEDRTYAVGGNQYGLGFGIGWAGDGF